MVSTIARWTASFNTLARCRRCLAIPRGLGERDGAGSADSSSSSARCDDCAEARDLLVDRGTCGCAAGQERISSHRRPAAGGAGDAGSRRRGISVGRRSRSHRTPMTRTNGEDQQGFDHQSSGSLHWALVLDPPRRGLPNGDLLKPSGVIDVLREHDGCRYNGRFSVNCADHGAAPE